MKEVFRLLQIHEVAVTTCFLCLNRSLRLYGAKKLYDLYLVLMQNHTYDDSISCNNPISWLVPLQFLAVSFVFFEHEDVVFAGMSVVVYAVVSLSASSFSCLCCLVSAFKRACRRFLAACSGLSLRAT